MRKYFTDIVFDIINIVELLGIIRPHQMYEVQTVVSDDLVAWCVCQAPVPCKSR